MIVEPFDHYPTSMTVGSDNGGLPTVWNIVPKLAFLGVDTSVVSLVTGLGGQGKGLKLVHSAGGGGWEMYRGFTPCNKFTLAFALRLDLLQHNCDDFMWFQNGSSRQFGLGITSTGRVRILGEGSGQVKLSPQLQLGQVYRFVMQIDLSAGTGANSSITTKCNGELMTELSGTNLDLVDSSSTNTDTIALQAFAYTNSTLWCDYTVDDLLIVENELLDLPPLEMFVQQATADVLSEWSHSTGATSFGVVDEIPLSVSDYNHSTTVNQKDILQFGNLPRTPESIFCVSELSIVKKEEAALRQLRNVLRIGGVDYNDADHSALEVYEHYFTHHRDNPATAVPFVAADFPLQSGYELRL